MLLISLIWLLCKAYLGNPAHHNMAFYVLIWTIPVGVLIISFPYIKRLFPEYENSFLANAKQAFIKDHRKSIIIILIIAVIIDVIFAQLFSIKIGDEATFQFSVKTLSEKEYTYFFENYGDMPWLGRQHPPLPILISSFVVNLIQGDVYFSSRGTAIFFGIGTLICTYSIAKILYGRQIALLSMVLLFCIRYFFLYHVKSGVDIYVTFFLSLSIFCLLKLNAIGGRINLETIGWVILAGITIGLGILSKYTMVLSYLLLPALFLWPFPNRFYTQNIPIKPSINLKNGLIIATLVFLISLPLIAVWAKYLFESGLYQTHLKVIAYYLGTNINIVQESIEVKDVSFFSSWRFRFVIKALTYLIPASIGLYLLPLVGIGVWTFLKKNSPSNERWSNLFIGYWLAIIFIPIFFTLPVNRYFMPAYPALAILMAYGLHYSVKNPIRIVLFALFFTLSSVFPYFN